MDIHITEESTHKLLFSVEGAGHALAGALKEELWEDEATTAAGYSVSHPLVGTPDFVLETSKKAPKKVLADAIKRLHKKLDALGAEVKKMKL